jgi:hypothetical protein
VGLVQREIEASGISTITLSPIADFTASVNPPRVAAIEYPLGQNFGRPGDSQGQMAVLRTTLKALEEMDQPGSVRHLPFEWPEKGSKGARASHPPEPPPITKYLMSHPWLYPKLIAGDIPE